MSTASPARIEANRRNALKSTGPRTEEGKARSRANALKHGLTGEGVAIPLEDAAEIGRRFEAMRAEFRPRTEMGCYLVRRAALLTVRLERCALQESAAISRNVRHAESRFDDDRQAEVESLFATLADDPAGHLRRIKRMPEGVDRLIAAWRSVVDDLLSEWEPEFTVDHQTLMESLMGRAADSPPSSEVGRLRALIRREPGALRPESIRGFSEGAARVWAAEQLLKLVEAEIAKLQAIRESIDLDLIEEDRAEAGARALFDPSQGATLARKYEAAAERALYRAVRDLKEVEAVAADNPPEPAAGRGHLASFFPDRFAAPDPDHQAEIDPPGPATGGDVAGHRAPGGEKGGGSVDVPSPIRV